MVPEQLGLFLALLLVVSHIALGRVLRAVGTLHLGARQGTWAVGASHTLATMPREQCWSSGTAGGQAGHLRWPCQACHSPR